MQKEVPNPIIASFNWAFKQGKCVFALFCIFVYCLVISPFYFLFLDDSIEINENTFQERNQWPPIKIFYYHLPDKFNKDIISKADPVVFTPYDMSYHFYIEVAFADCLNQTPLLTDNIEEADFIYLDFFPTYLDFDMHKTQWRRVGKEFYDYIQEKGLLKYRNLFTIRAYPFKNMITSFLIGYTGSLEKIKRRKFFTIPYISNYSHFPPSAVNFSKPRKYEVFLAGSYRRQRKKIFKIMSTMKNSYSMIMDRLDLNLTEEQLYLTPYIMSETKYCIVPNGDSPTSKRFFDAILYGCIPVIISDGYEYPFDKTIVNWEECVVKIPQNKIKHIPDIIGNISNERYEHMFQYLQKAREHIRFDNGVLPTNGVGSILWQLYYYKESLGWKDWIIHLFEILHAEYEKRNSFYKKKNYILKNGTKSLIR